ncbi:MAG: AraC family transcriptional regulator [Candidatus Phocaeicola faecipullorum]|nr:AraC family transcriptional regulator [Candidatus Phocaeicola faecipullorum]
MSIRLGDKTYLLIGKKLDEWKRQKGFLCLGLTIQALSKSIGVNRTYLSNYVNDTYGRNFNRWVNELRIEEAKSRMKTAENSLAEIAAQVGFADLAHFSKQFKRKEGLSPSAWRKKLR